MVAKGIPTNVRVKEDQIIKRIKDAVKNDGFIYGRLMLGILLEKEEDCKGKGDKIIEEIKNELGEEDFRVTFLELLNDWFCQHEDWDRLFRRKCISLVSTFTFLSRFPETTSACVDHIQGTAWSHAD